MSGQRCALEIVAETTHCTLARCVACGGYQLSLGPVTVRLPAHVLEELRYCLNEVQMRVAADAVAEETAAEAQPLPALLAPRLDIKH